MLLALKLFPKLTFAFPDILSALFLFVLIIFKSFENKKYSNSVFSRMSLFFALISFLATLIYSSFDKKFDTGLFVYNYRLGQMKIILLAMLCLWFFYINYTQLYKTLNSNFFILIYGIVNAITLSLSANNFLVLILSLELYSFSLAFLLLNDKQASERQVIGSRKCATRFLLISSVMSAIFIFGCSLLYSQFGSLSFLKIKLTNDFSSVVGGVLVLCALLFKIGCPPFHGWIIDVYEKASSIIVLFLETFWKPFMIFIFIRVLLIFLAGKFDQCRLILSTVAIIAMLFGAIMPIMQRNIHRFIATASIGHIGFLMTVFATFTSIKPISFVVSYLAFYSLAVFCFLSGILTIKHASNVDEFSDLSGIVNINPLIGFLLLLAMCAMIGLPPFGNFVAKLFVFKFLIQSKATLLLSVTMIYSVFSLLYIIKWARFFFADSAQQTFASNRNFSSTLSLFVLCSSIFFFDFINSYFLRIFQTNA